jgi:hypothetical protein
MLPMPVKKTARKTVPAKRDAQDKGMVQRLKDQRTVYRKAQEIHGNPRMLKELAFYPMTSGWRRLLTKKRMTI